MKQGSFVERSRTRDISQKERDKKMRDQCILKYITSMQRYLRTVD